jgi:hypothetical protein
MLTQFIIRLERFEKFSPVVMHHDPRAAFDTLVISS